jgi:hypothetical protein
MKRSRKAIVYNYVDFAVSVPEELSLRKRAGLIFCNVNRTA